MCVVVLKHCARCATQSRQVSSRSWARKGVLASMLPRAFSRLSTTSCTTLLMARTCSSSLRSAVSRASSALCCDALARGLAASRAASGSAAAAESRAERGSCWTRGSIGASGRRACLRPRSSRASSIAGSLARDFSHCQARPSLDAPPPSPRRPIALHPSPTLHVAIVASSSIVPPWLCYCLHLRLCGQLTWPVALWSVCCAQWPSVCNLYSAFLSPTRCSQIHRRHPLTLQGYRNSSFAKSDCD